MKTHRFERRRVHCEVKCSKSPSGRKSLEGENGGSDPKNGYEGKDGAQGGKKSPPGAVTERDTEREREKRRREL